MVGVRFVSFDQDAEIRLFELLERITSEPDKLMHEWHGILEHKAESA
jgi:hypothetical protein